MSVNLIPPEAFISVVAFLEMAQISECAAVCGARCSGGEAWRYNCSTHWPSPALSAPLHTRGILIVLSPTFV